MRQLYLLRHGEPLGGDGRIRGQTNDPLTELGWQQMRQATENLAFDRIVTSPLQRCANFAQHIAHQRQLPLVTDKRLIEMGMGAWEGKAKSDIMPTPDFEWRYSQNPQHYLAKDAEPFEQIQKRAQDWLNEYKTRTETSTLVVAHAGIMRFLLAEIIQMPIEAALRIKLPFAACLKLRVAINDDRLMGHLYWPSA